MWSDPKILAEVIGAAIKIPVVSFEGNYVAGTREIVDKVIQVDSGAAEEVDGAIYRLSLQHLSNSFLARDA